MGGAAAGSDITSAPATIVSPRLLTEVTDIAGTATSSDGSTVAFRTETASIERHTYDSSWYVVDLHMPAMLVRTLGSASWRERLTERVGLGGRSLILTKRVMSVLLDSI